MQCVKTADANRMSVKFFHVVNCLHLNLFASQDCSDLCSTVPLGFTLTFIFDFSMLHHTCIRSTATHICIYLFSYSAHLGLLCSGKWELLGVQHDRKIMIWYTLVLWVARFGLIQACYSGKKKQMAIFKKMKNTHDPS